MCTEIALETLSLLYSFDNQVQGISGSDPKEDAYSGCYQYYDRLLKLLEINLLEKELQSNGSIPKPLSRGQRAFSVLTRSCETLAYFVPAIAILSHAEEGVKHMAELIHFGFLAATHAEEAKHEAHHLDHNNLKLNLRRDDYIKVLAFELTWHFRYEIKQLKENAIQDLVDLHGRYLIRRICEEADKGQPLSVTDLKATLIREINPDLNDLVKVAKKSVDQYQRCREERWLNSQQDPYQKGFLQRVTEELSQKALGIEQYMRVLKATRRLADVKLCFPSLVSHIHEVPILRWYFDVPKTYGSAYLSRCLASLGMDNYQLRFSTTNTKVALCMLRCSVVSGQQLGRNTQVRLNDYNHIFWHTFSIEGKFLKRQIDEVNRKVTRLESDLRDTKNELDETKRRLRFVEEKLGIKP